MHNKSVLERVPAERLLVIKTHEISSRSADIAEFVGVPAATLQPNAAHTNRVRGRHGVLDQIPRSHLAAKIREHCGWLMPRFFPEAYHTLDAASSLAA
jgi:hypothetical protein